MTHLPCHLSPRWLLFSMFLLYYCTILTDQSCFVVRDAHSLLALMFMTNCDMWDDKNFTKLFTKLVYVVRYPQNLYLVSTSVSSTFTGLGNAWWKQNWFSSWCPMMHDVNDWSNSGVYWETTQILNIQPRYIMTTIQQVHDRQHTEDFSMSDDLLVVTDIWFYVVINKY